MLLYQKKTSTNYYESTEVCMRIISRSRSAMHENTQPMGDDDDPTLPTRNVRRRCRVLSTHMSPDALPTYLLRIHDAYYCFFPWQQDAPRIRALGR